MSPWGHCGLSPRYQSLAICDGIVAIGTPHSGIVMETSEGAKA